jgi:hypothetical protein
MESMAPEVGMTQMGARNTMGTVEMLTMQSGDSHPILFLVLRVREFRHSNLHCGGQRVDVFDIGGDSPQFFV